MPRFLSRIFTSSLAKHNYVMSYYELYMDSVRDLLSPGKSSTTTSIPEDADIRKGTKEGPTVHLHPTFGAFVTDLTENVVTTVEEALALCEFGNQMRSVTQTTVHPRSSRSHAIIQFRIMPRKEDTGDSEKMGTLVTFCDLASQEQEKVLQGPQQRFKELTFINRSICHLNHCIQKLNMRDKRKSTFMTYSEFRNSNLTMLLAHALTGESKTALMATVSPSAHSYDDTLATLRFCSSVKRIQTMPTITTISRKDVVEQLKSEIQNLKDSLSEGTSGQESLTQELALTTAMCEYYKLTWEQIKRRSREYSR